MKNDRRILRAIFKNPKGSDRKIAASLGISQPTVTRHRIDFVNRGIFKYVAVPDFEKMGYKIIAISECKKSIETTRLIYKDDTIIFALDAVHTILILHKHKDFGEYDEFCRKYKVENSIPASAKKGILKNITFESP